MYLLDTDHLSIAYQDTIEGFSLGRRLSAVPADELFASIVTYEEQMRGWMSYIARAKTIPAQVEGYARLRLHVDRYKTIPLLDFDAAAGYHFGRLREARIRLATMDLKIAAIALANGATLLTRNLSDFAKVPDLRLEDWTA